MEKSDRERQMPCGLTYTRHLKNKTNKPTKRNRLIDTENEPVIAGWGRSGAWEKGGGDEEGPTGGREVVAGR